MMPARFVTLLLLLWVVSCMPTQQSVVVSPSTVFRGGTALVGAGQEPMPNAAVVVTDGRIRFIGTIEEATGRYPAATVVDLDGMTMLPGLVDAHAHVNGLALALDTVDLTRTSSLQEVVRRIESKADDTPAGEWITGRGWDQNDWPGKTYPTASALQSITGHPVFVRRIDGHAALVNHVGLRLAAITSSTPDPEGGKILRDESGEPTGILIDSAMELVEDIIPRPSRELRKQRLVRATQAIASAGLTGVHEAGAAHSDELIEIYRELLKEGNLPVRIYFMLPGEREVLRSWFARGPSVGTDNMLTVRSVKLYADGALGSRGAALLSPYSDAPETTGLLLTRTEEIARIAREARAAGFQVGTHAIGDRGNRNVIDAYEEAGVEPDDRFRIEHVQVIALEDIPRMADRGIIASVQPTHATSDMPWAEDRVGPQRIAGAYAWQTLRNAGVRLALGSDFPVEEVSPFLGIYAAVTRRDLDGRPPGGWRAHERLTLAEAVRGFTLDAAYAGFQDDDLGTIEVGKLADFTIVEGDFLNTPAEEIPRTRVRYTVVGGRIVYNAASGQ